MNLRPEQLAARVERLVIGSDFGADGYTTVAQADELARRLELRPGLRLLDLGCGSGWPGLYLSMQTGCRVVLSDVPLDGLRRAARGRSASGSAPDAPSLPPADRTFRSRARASTRSSTPTCSVDCGRSSPC